MDYFKRLKKARKPKKPGRIPAVSENPIDVEKERQKDRLSKSCFLLRDSWRKFAEKILPVWKSIASLTINQKTGVDMSEMDDIKKFTKKAVKASGIKSWLYGIIAAGSAVIAVYSGSYEVFIITLISGIESAIDAYESIKE